MKAIPKRTSVTLLLAAAMTMGLMAQPRTNTPGNRPGWNADNAPYRQCLNIPDLTDEQKAELKTLRMERLQESQTYRNKMGEIRARQRTLMSTVPYDQKAMDKLTDEKTTLMNKHLKAGNAHKAAISEILTEEQQVYLNQMQHRRQQFARKGAGRTKNFTQGKRGGRGGYGKGAYGRATW